MDVLAAYQARGRASLEHTALLLGLPGKLGMSGDQVFDYWKAGRIAEIRAYCETDVFNTYLVWLRFQLIRGQLSPGEYAAELARAARLARRARGAALARIRRGLGPCVKAAPAIETAEIESLDHEGRGVAHVDGKAVFVERCAARRVGQLPPHAPAAAPRRGGGRRGAARGAGARHAALPSFRHLRRLLPAAPRPRGAARGERPHRRRGARAHRRHPAGTLAAAADRAGVGLSPPRAAGLQARRQERQGLRRLPRARQPLSRGPRSLRGARAARRRARLGARRARRRPQHQASRGADRSRGRRKCDGARVARAGRPGRGRPRTAARLRDGITASRSTCSAAASRRSRRSRRRRRRCATSCPGSPRASSSRRPISCRSTARSTGSWWRARSSCWRRSPRTGRSTSSAGSETSACRLRCRSPRSTASRSTRRWWRGRAPMRRETASPMPHFTPQTSRPRRSRAPGRAPPTISCCSTRRAPARAKCCRSPCPRGRAASSTCPATRAASRATQAYWRRNWVTASWRPGSWTCFRTPRTSSPSRYSSRSR